VDIAPQFSYFTRITEGKRNPTRRQQTKDGKGKLPPGVDHVEDRASTPQSKEDKKRSTGNKDAADCCISMSRRNYTRTLRQERKLRPQSRSSLPTLEIPKTVLEQIINIS
jgi:hypothetical protein